MTHEIEFFKPNRVYSTYGSSFGRVTKWKPLDWAVVLDIIYLVLFNIIYLILSHVPVEYEPEPMWDFSWMTYLLFNLPVLYFAVAAIGRKTHLYSQIRMSEEYVLDKFEDLPLEYQAEFGGKQGLLTMTRDCSTMELKEIASGFESVRNTYAEEAEILRKARSQAPEVMKKIEAIRTEREDLNTQYQEALEG